MSTHIPNQVASLDVLLCSELKFHGTQYNLENYGEITTRKILKEIEVVNGIPKLRCSHSSESIQTAL